MNQTQLLRHLRQIFNTFLSKYFDGNEHVFGLSSLTFPLINILFGRQQLSDQEVVENADNGSIENKYSLNIIFAPSLKSGFKTRKASVHSTVIQPLLMYVYTNNADDDWTDNDNIQNLLGVLFFGATTELAASGVRVVSVGQPNAIEYGPEHNLQASQRSIQIRYELDYERAE